MKSFPDLIKKAKLAGSCHHELLLTLKRFNDDFKTVRYEFVNLDNIISNPRQCSNLTLRKGDELIISSKSTYVDAYEVNVEGAVRNPAKFALGAEKNMKVSDAIFFSGGLRDDAIEDFAYIFRNKGDDAKTVEYIPVNLKEALKNPSSSSNISLEPKDRLVVYSKNNYTDESFVKVAGAVRSPGEFLYNPTLKLKDVMLLAGGFRREASLDRIDVYQACILKKIKQQECLLPI
jgi:hypothetical protein